MALRPVPGASRPSGTAAEMLRQMKGLAREFRGLVDVEKGGTELRLLSQPVYRFEGEGDGALFAFVLTTDAEAFLLIEERAGENGAPSWHYGFARMSNHSLAARRGERVVWESARDPDDGNPGKPFLSRWDVGPRE